MTKDNSSSDMNLIIGDGDNDGVLENTALSGFLNNLILERIGRVAMSETDANSEEGSSFSDDNSANISISSTTSSIPTTDTTDTTTTTTTTTSDDEFCSRSGVRTISRILVAQDNARANLGPRTPTQRSQGLELGRGGRVRISTATLRDSRWYSSNSNNNSNHNKNNKSSLKHQHQHQREHQREHRRRGSLSSAIETAVALVTISSSCDENDDDDDDDVSLSLVHLFATTNSECNSDTVHVPQTISQQPTTATMTDMPHRIPQRSQDWYYNNDDDHDQDQDHLSSSRTFNRSYSMNTNTNTNTNTMVQRSLSDDVTTTSLHKSTSTLSSRSSYHPPRSSSSTMMRRSSDSEVGGCRWSAMITRSSSKNKAQDHYHHHQMILPPSPPCRLRTRQGDSDRSICSSIINDAMEVLAKSAEKAT